MKKYALFLGCNIPARVRQYADSAVAVLERLGVGLVDIPMFNCCGYPMRNYDQTAFLLSSARNMALAKKAGLDDMLVMCSCCYGSLKKAEYVMKEGGRLRKKIDLLLAQNDLEFSDSIQVKHLLSVLYVDVGIETIRDKISQPFDDLKIGAHYGCHALRPSKITQFDDPVAPSLFDELVELTGARSVDWPSRLECCGAPLTGVNDHLSMSLAGKKLSDVRDAGAEYLCTACPFCYMQFNAARENGCSSILYPQLLGLSMGIDRETLGVSDHMCRICTHSGQAA